MACLIWEMLTDPRGKDCEDGPDLDDLRIGTERTRCWAAASRAVSSRWGPCKAQASAVPLGARQACTTSGRALAEVPPLHARGGAACALLVRCLYRNLCEAHFTETSASV